MLFAFSSIFLRYGLKNENSTKILGLGLKFLLYLSSLWCGLKSFSKFEMVYICLTNFCKFKQHNRESIASYKTNIKNKHIQTKREKIENLSFVFTKKMYMFINNLDSVLSLLHKFLMAEYVSS